MGAQLRSAGAACGAAAAAAGGRGVLRGGGVPAACRRQRGVLRAACRGGHVYWAEQQRRRRGWLEETGWWHEGWRTQPEECGRAWRAQRAWCVRPAARRRPQVAGSSATPQGAAVGRPRSSRRIPELWERGCCGPFLWSAGVSQVLVSVGQERCAPQVPTCAVGSGSLCVAGRS